MADIFEKGIEDLNARDPIIVLCGEVGSMVGRFSDGNLSESKTTEDLIEVYHTKFDGKEQYFENILLLMKRVAKELPGMSENGSFVSKALLNTVLNSLKKDNTEDIIKFYDSVSSSLDEYMFTRNDEAFISKVMNALSDEDKEEKGLQVISPRSVKPLFTINEVVAPDKKEKVKIEDVKENKKEEISKDEKRVSHHLLWYVLNNVRDEDSNRGIEYEDSEGKKRYATDRQYTKNPELVSDKSKIFFQKSQVYVGNHSNSLNISHKKNEVTDREAIASSFKGVVDYMESKAEIPFEFKINTKSDEFKKEMVSTILMYVKINEVNSKVKSLKAKKKVFELAEVETDSNEKGLMKEDFVLKGKVSSFNIDGKVFSYADFVNFAKSNKGYDDFVKFEEKIEEKEKEAVRQNLLKNQIINNVNR